jgi:alpha-glucoside transport system substrate-binding protein
MLPVDRQQRDKVDQLVEDYTQRGLSRRDFFKRAVALGLSASVAGALLEACGGSSGGGSSNSVDVLNVWSTAEADSFKAMMAPFTQQNGIQIKVESTRDLDAVLTTRIRGNNPPDIAILPNPAKMQQLASQGHLIALDSFLDMGKIHSDYATTWTDLGTYNGKLYGIFMKAANKGTIWFNPAQASAAGLSSPPATFDDLITISNTLAGAGKYPWSMGVSSGSASGWPAADWIDQIYLLANGPDMYDKWVAHKIPWTDSSVKQAFQTFGRIAHGNHYINGAPASILATGFAEATYLLYNNPPTAYLNYLGDFAATFIKTQFASLQPGSGYNFFPFPTINPSYASPATVTGGADIVAALRNTDAVKKFVQYVATAQAQEIWVKRGGFTSINKAVSLDSYPDAVSKASAQMLVNATTFRFGADDLMPPAVESAFWKACLDYIQSPGNLDSSLSTVESTASSAYTS